MTLAGIAAMTMLAADVLRPMALDDLYALKRVSESQISPDGKHVVWAQLEIVDPAANKSKSNLWLADADGKTPPRRLTTTEKKDNRPRWKPDGASILFESNRSGSSQLWAIDLAGGEARQLTSISTGAATGVWSRDGKKIAFVSAVWPAFSTLPFAESDQKNRDKAEAIEKDPVKAKVFTKLFYRHWVEYVDDKRQHLFVCDADGKNCHDATPGDRDAYPTSTTFSVGDDFTFSPDGTHLVFTAVPAKGEAWSTNYDLCRVAIDNSKTEWETLTKNPAADSCPRFSPDGKLLAWRAQAKAGYEADKWDIVVSDCKANGSIASAPKPLLAELDRSADDFAWRDNDALVFAAEEDAGKPLWILSLTGGRPRKLEGFTTGQITGFSLPEDGAKVVASFATLRRPAETFVMTLGEAKSTGVGRIVEEPNGRRPLSRANTELLSEIERPRPEAVALPVEGGNMHMWLLKPPGFDAAKKYPVVYLVHGGPQGAWEDGWSFRWCPTLWAAQGYVIAMPNPRGSTGFGQKFVDEISGDWGGKCYRDLVAGLEHVKKLPYVDAQRMGTAGASFGGYMQNWFAVNDIAKEFQCQINHCSVWNFESMWGTTDELWFDEWEHGGMPWEKPQKYREFSPHVRAAELAKHKVPMLVIHNDLDFRCPIGQGHELFTALQRQGVKSRFVNFPDEGHHVLKPANGKRWHAEVFAWLKEHVPPGGR